MNRRRLIGRAAVGAVFLLIAGTAALMPWREDTVDPVVIPVTPPAEQTVLACSGPLLLLGADRNDAGLLVPAALQTLTTGIEKGAELQRRSLATPDVPRSAATGLTALPHDGRRAEAAAVGSARVDGTDLRGLAASACTRPTAETWLVGGSVDVGSADIVLLTNPGAVAARADITVYGGDGEVAPAAGAGIVVAPGTQRAIPLASFALGQSQPVLRVAASSAPLQVALQSSITRTLVPGGVDVGAAVSAPETTLIVPGVRIASAPAGEETTTSLRLLSPGGPAEATVTLVAADGTTVGPLEIALDGATPAVLALPRVPVGTYAVRIEATAPVVAAVWHATGLQAGADYAWFVPAQPLAGPTLAAVAAGPSPELVLVGGEEDRVVRVTDAAGEGTSRRVDVRAGRVVVLPATEGEIYLIDPAGAGVRASVTYSAAGALAAYPIAPSEEAAAVLDVTVR